MTRRELHDAAIEEIDIEGVLDFAEAVAMDAARLWVEASLDQRQRLQTVLFPTGVTYVPGRGFGTTETGLLFRWLAVGSAGKSGKASHMMLSLNQILPWLREMDALRRVLAA